MAPSQGKNKQQTALEALFQSLIPEPATQHPLGNLLEMQVLGFHQGLTQWEALGLGHSGPWVILRLTEVWEPVSQGRRNLDNWSHCPDALGSVALGVRWLQGWASPS